MRKEISVTREREQACPDAASLEYILLLASQDRSLLQAFELHFLTCSTCQRRIHRMMVFYGILERELQKPTTVRVSRLAAKLCVPVE